MEQGGSHRSGMLIGLAGFALLSCGDAVIKSIAGQWPGLAVAALRFSIGTVVLALVMLWREGRAGLHVALPGVQLLRGFGLALATMAFFSAVYVMPLATATIVTFISPIITAVAASLFLGERTARSTWVTAILAFIGVAMVLQPDVRDFRLTSLLPLGSAIGTSMLIIGNRLAVGSGSALKMQYLIALFALPFLIAGAVVGHVYGGPVLQVTMPGWTVVARTALVAVTASMSHFLIYVGVSRAGANDVAPMQYVQALVTLMIGIVAFGDWPNGLSLLGAAIIIAAGYWQLRSMAQRSNQP